MMSSDSFLGAGKMFKIFYSVLALLFISIGIFFIYDFPYMQHIVLVISLFGFIVVLRNQLLWLYLIPALLPVYDLGLHTGRIFVTEFDIFLAVCLAALYLKKSLSNTFSFEFQREDFIIFLIFLSALISLLIYIPFKPVVDANSFSSYISPFNGLRVIKGTFWIFLYWPFLKQGYSYNTIKFREYLVNGVLTGVFLMGLCVLWERGILKGIFGLNLYGVLEALLDFSSSYRITGMFSSMHVGGTALDGYLILTFPFCVAAFLKNSSVKFKVFSFFCLGLSSYAIMVSFSRGLYLGFFSSVAVVVLCRFVFSSKAAIFKKSQLLFLLIIFLFFTGYIYSLFQYGGYQVMLAAILTVLGAAFVTQYSKNINLYLTAALISIGAIFMMYVSYDGFVESKWSQNSRLFSFYISLCSCLFLSIITYFITSRVTHSNQTGLLTVLMLSGVFWIVVIPSASGYKMIERFSTSTADLSHRTSHWLNTLGYMDDNFSNVLFGNGLGSFPAYYLYNNLSNNTTVNYAFLKDPETSFLSMSGGDYNIIQKINIKPETNYSFYVRAKSDAQSTLTIKVCPRHVIFSSRYTPECVTRSLKLDPGNQWNVFEASFNSGGLGKNSFLYWPITLQFQYGALGSTLEISDFELLDDSGNDIIANSDFSKGSDRWSFVRDFSHDDWHIKNIYLNYYFEQGIFGIFTFLIAIAFATLKQFQALRDNIELSPVLLASIAGALTVGIFGSMVDNPRIAFLFLLVLSVSFINILENKPVKH